MKCKIKFIEPLLGSQPGNKTPASDFVQKKMADAITKDGGDASALLTEEAQTLPEALEKGTTVFHLVDGQPILYNYQVKGMLKEAAEKMNGLDGVKNLRNKLQAYVYIEPRRIPIKYKGEIQVFERPLRGMTMQGPRISLARSEMIPAGAQCEFTIRVIEQPTEKAKIDIALVKKLFEFAQNLGLGQWRGSNLYGQFEYELSDK